MFEGTKKNVYAQKKASIFSFLAFTLYTLHPTPYTNLAHYLSLPLKPLTF